MVSQVQPLKGTEEGFRKKSLLHSQVPEIVRKAHHQGETAGWSGGCGQE